MKIEWMDNVGSMPGIVLGFILMLVVSGCASTQNYSMRYERAQKALFENLHLKQSRMTGDTEPGQARVEGALKNSMSMGIYGVDQHRHVPGERMSFTVRHGYNIGATGSESIYFELLGTSPGTTRITVDYSDRWYGIFPPFVFYNPGLLRESRIHKIIWKKGVD
ncbi:MAG: hypothetical protein ABEJ65_04735 [bacterium]